MPTMDYLTGRVFTRLTVRELAAKDEHGSTFWLCDCACGATRIVRRDALTAERRPTRSCGCLREEWIRSAELRAMGKRLGERNRERWAAKRAAEAGAAA